MEKLFVGKPNIGKREVFLRRVNEVLDRGWLSNDGPVLREFEQRIAEIINVKHAVAMCNATAAIEIACHALGLKGEVIVPSYTFIATAHALQWQGIAPVFADMDPSTPKIDPSQIEHLITPKTTGIIGVHVWGRGCDTEAIEGVAAKYKLKVMYDSSHAFGCSRNGKNIGTFGECEVFSFHATKFINSLEGGAVTTNNTELAEKLRLMRNFGFVDFDKVTYLGINGKMNEISAAMGLTNLESMEHIVAINRRNYLEYKVGLTSVSGINLIEYDLNEKNNFQYIVLEVDPEKCPRQRDEIVKALHAENVIARKYFWPGCHGMEPYRSQWPDISQNLKQTEKIAAKVVVLPTGLAVGVGEIRKICSQLKRICSD